MVMKVFKINYWLSLVLFIVSTVSVSAFAQMQPYGIEVTGKGAVMATPDIFLLHFTVVERGKNVEKVKQLVDSKSNQLIKAATSLGIDKANIEAYEFNIYPIYQQSSIRLNNTELNQQFANGESGRVHLSTEPDKEINIATMAVSRQIKIKLKQISQFDTLITKATKIGIKQISPLQTEVSDPELLYQKALEQAILDAKNKANYIAGQSGVSLGAITYVKELSYGAPMQMAFAEAKQGFDSIVGQQQIQAQVIINWSIAK